MKEGMASMYVDWEYYKIFYYVAINEFCIRISIGIICKKTINI